MAIMVAAVMPVSGIADRVAPVLGLQVPIETLETVPNALTCGRSKALHLIVTEGCL